MVIGSERVRLPRHNRMVRRLVTLVALALATSTALASDLSVDRRTVPIDDTVTITLKLDGDAAEAEPGALPVKNLEIIGEPSVSSEFSWINGAVSRRKTLRYTARPVGPGPALVGPLVLKTSGGEERLAPVSLQVVPDEATGSNDPQTVLRGLMAAGRPLSFMIAEADRTDVFEGEQIIVTWYLYNAANIQRWQLEAVPKLADFWSEDLELDQKQQTREYVGELAMQKVPLRRVALYPLRSGRFVVGGPRVSAAVMSRNPGALGALFEGSLSEIRLRADPIAVNVRPLPPGPPVDVIGEVTLECGEAVQKPGGPVTMLVGLRGTANIRTAEAPRLEGSVEGATEVESASFEFKPAGNGAAMRRRWRYVIFPTRSGSLTVPAVSLRVFNPRTGERTVLRCPPHTLQVSAVEKPQAAPAQSAPAGRPLLPLLLRGGGAVLLLGLLAFVFLPFLRRESRRRGIIGKLTETTVPAHIRIRVASLLHARGIDFNALAKETSERGDAYRALSSLLEAIERDRIDAAEGRRELKARLRDLVQSLE